MSKTAPGGFFVARSPATARGTSPCASHGYATGAHAAPSNEDAACDIASQPPHHAASPAPARKEGRGPLFRCCAALQRLHRHGAQPPASACPPARVPPRMKMAPPSGRILL